MEYDKDLSSLENRNAEAHYRLMEIQRRLDEFQKTAQNLLIFWASAETVKEEDKLERKEVLRRLNEEEDEYEKLFKETYERKEALEESIRKKWLAIFSDMQTEKAPKSPYNKLNESLLLSSLCIKTEFAVDDIYNAVDQWHCNSKQVDFKVNAAFFDEVERKRRVDLDWDEEKKHLIAENTYYGCSIKGEFKNHHVCIKVYKKLRKEEFEHYNAANESLRKSVGHRNLLSPVGYCTFASLDCILFDFAENLSLDDYLKNPNDRISFSFPQKIDIIKDIFVGLSWLHSHNTFHYRLKPSNILFNSDWKVKIGDYNLPLVTSMDQGVLFNHSYCHYFDPSVFKTKKFTPECDVWAFGMLIYTIIEEKIPFSGAKSYSEVEHEVTKIAISQKPLNIFNAQTFSPIYPQCFASPRNFHQLSTLVDWETIKKNNISNQSLVQEIWSEAERLNAGGAGAQDKIPWSIFVKTFYMKLSNSKRNIDIREFNIYDKILRFIFPGAPQINQQQTLVSLEDFARFVKNFPIFPLTTQDGPKYLDNLQQFVKGDYFFGILGRVEAENILTFDRRKSTYLVRISASNQYQICFSTFNHKQPNQPFLHYSEPITTNFYTYVLEKKATLEKTNSVPQTDILKPSTLIN